MRGDPWKTSGAQSSETALRCVKFLCTERAYPKHSEVELAVLLGLCRAQEERVGRLEEELSLLQDKLATEQMLRYGDARFLQFISHEGILHPTGLDLDPFCSRTDTIYVKLNFTYT